MDRTSAKVAVGVHCPGEMGFTGMLLLLSG